MCLKNDWYELKNKIASENGELTLLWMVGLNNRNHAHELGIYSWKDERCNNVTLNINGEITAPIVNKMIEMNRNSDKIILPDIISNNIGNWKNEKMFDFFIDFETFNDVIKDINIPYANDKNIIFLIGLGYYHPFQDCWKYKSFIVNALSENEEERICREFVKYVNSKVNKYKFKPRFIHWHNIEDLYWNIITDKYNIEHNFFDWLNLMAVFKTEPVVIKNCMSFSLKDIAKHMFKHKLIKNIWTENDCSNGSLAMLNIHLAEVESKKNNTLLIDSNLTKDIIKYNFYDVLVLYELINYLRKNHCDNNATIISGNELKFDDNYKHIENLQDVNSLENLENLENVNSIEILEPIILGRKRKRDEF